MHLRRRACLLGTLGGKQGRCYGSGRDSSCLSWAGGASGAPGGGQQPPGAAPGQAITGGENGPGPGMQEAVSKGGWRAHPLRAARVRCHLAFARSHHAWSQPPTSTRHAFPRNRLRHTLKHGYVTGIWYSASCSSSHCAGASSDFPKHICCCRCGPLCLSG
jgi:hypothetical protein